jgi:hypothetical protein
MNDLVVISSDDTPLYFDFLNIVTTQWYKYIGIPVLFIHITSEESEIEKTEYGFIKKISKIPEISTGLQSQICRLYAYSYFPDKRILTSDIDMLPLNKQFFMENRCEADKVCIYTNNAYPNVPYYPMCYISAIGNLMSQILELDETFETFSKRLYERYSGVWYTDELFLYDSLLKHENKLIKVDRDYRKQRICRSNWEYDVQKLKRGEYVDSHLLRPFNINSNAINKIIDINNTEGHK